MLETFKKWWQRWGSEELCQLAVGQCFSACDVIHHRRVHGFQEGANVQKSGVSQLQVVVLLFGFDVPPWSIPQPLSGISDHYCPTTAAMRKYTMSLERPLSKPLKPRGTALGAQGDAAMTHFPLLEICYPFLWSMRLLGTLVLSCWSTLICAARLLQISVYCEDNLDFTVHLFSC